MCFFSYLCTYYCFLFLHGALILFVDNIIAKDVAWIFFSFFFSRLGLHTVMSCLHDENHEGAYITNANYCPTTLRKRLVTRK